MEKSEHKIIIVDDDHDDQLFLTEALFKCSASLKVFSVFNGVQLFDLLASKGAYAGCLSGKPDLIVLDLNMPVMDGKTTLSLLKNNPALAEIPVYILTTSRRGADNESCVEMGANGFITKPADLPSLDRIAEFLVSTLEERRMPVAG